MADNEDRNMDENIDGLHTDDGDDAVVDASVTGDLGIDGEQYKESHPDADLAPGFSREMAEEEGYEVGDDDEAEAAEEMVEKAAADGDGGASLEVVQAEIGN